MDLYAYIYTICIYISMTRCRHARTKTRDIEETPSRLPSYSLVNPRAFSHDPPQHSDRAAKRQYVTHISSRTHTRARHDDTRKRRHTPPRFLCIFNCTFLSPKYTSHAYTHAHTNEARMTRIEDASRRLVRRRKS